MKVAICLRTYCKYAHFPDILYFQRFISQLDDAFAVLLWLRVPQTVDYKVSNVSVNLYSALSHCASNALGAPSTAETDAS